jgi:hypothetical protein
MPYFGKSSKEQRETLHSDLQRVVDRAIEITDFTIICGLRDEAGQAKAVAEKRSKAEYPKSRHNRSKKEDGTYDYTKSDAVDLAPYPIKWPDIRKQTTMEYVRRMGRFYFLAGVILAVAFMEGVKLRWGGFFKSLFDGPHFERVVE